MTPTPRRFRLPAWGWVVALVLGGLALDYATVPLIRPADRDSWSATRLRLDHTAQVLGDGIVLGAAVSALGLLGWLYGSRRLAVGGKWLLASLLIGGFWTHVVKQLVGRPRPRQWALFGHGWPEPFGFQRSFDSFPSGHAIALFSLVPLLGGLFPRARVAVIVIAALLAFGRVYGGDHYPTDIAAGAWLGALIGRYTLGRWRAEMANDAA